MLILRHTDPDFPRTITRFDRHAAPSPEVRETVAAILEAVRMRGDEALVEYTAKFGGPALTPETLAVPPEAFARAREKVDAPTREAIAAAHENVRAFAAASRRKDWTRTNAQGVEVGERFDPFGRVGIYVPGGTAPLVSTAVMTCTLAKEAGVEQIVVTTPADARGEVNPALLYALELTGATEVYKVGGAQAVAALAYGTATIEPVAKIFGPGNAYVVEAKRQVFGRVSIDLLPGPSEILVIADESANPAWVAADLLAQAEHGKNSGVVLVTDSEAILTGVQEEITRQAALLSRGEHLRGVLAESTSLILVPDLDAAVDLCNRYAPEHTSLATRQDDAIAARLRTSGGIFIGGYSPVVGGDFMAGPSHTLPTGGAGKSFPGLTVDQFQRRTSLVRFDRESLKRSLPVIGTFATLEGLDAHGRSAEIRLE